MWSVSGQKVYNMTLAIVLEKEKQLCELGFKSLVYLETNSVKIQKVWGSKPKIVGGKNVGGSMPKRFGSVKWLEAKKVYLSQVARG